VASLVVDPVMVAKGGARLVDADAAGALVRELFPMATVVTPNLPEAAALTGRDVASWEDARTAALAIVEMGARSVIFKGGHFEQEDTSTDLFYEGTGFREYTAIRVRSSNTHGTGCTFASAIAAGLAKGLTLRDAIALAKSYVTLAIQHAYPVGGGHGPLHHFYRYWQPSGSPYRPGVRIEAGS
jgi:hydroxymethylpyrimidine/phosphomethylpyrimidine kinase